ncbi:hypothetical protein GCM10023189_35970 [Nibrella saemangeumensis]|uniref:Uncharacterized protein n=1 Tax=Nibrella saemangeumensis TaxID=1084526 RepID=A0ABP8N6B4_9BACT
MNTQTKTLSAQEELQDNMFSVFGGTGIFCIPSTILKTHYDVGEQKMPDNFSPFRRVINRNFIDETIAYYPLRGR